MFHCCRGFLKPFHTLVKRENPAKPQRVYQIANNNFDLAMKKPWYAAPPTIHTLSRHLGYVQSLYRMAQLFI